MIGVVQADGSTSLVEAVHHGEGVRVWHHVTLGGSGRQQTCRHRMGSWNPAVLKTVPVSLRLTRKGDAFTLFAGRPGEPLEKAGSVTLALEGTVYAGLAVSSHQTGTLETAVYSDLEMEAK